MSAIFFSVTDIVTVVVGSFSKFTDVDVSVGDEDVEDGLADVGVGVEDVELVNIAMTLFSEEMDGTAEVFVTALYDKKRCKLA